jgi:uncharacterized cupin superfamily protein
VVSETQLLATKNGLVPDGQGWFVVNARESRWRDGGPLGVFCTFEGRQRFRQLGITLNVLEPGQPMAMYHRERAQEGLLVITGECLLIVQGDERRLVAWDFFHCPSGTEHVIVGSGNAAALVLAVGARGRGRDGGVVYRACETAARNRASVEHDTTDAREAYGKAYERLPRSKWIPYLDGWLPDC